jgi:hypothetical protein
MRNPRSYNGFTNLIYQSDLPKLDVFNLALLNLRGTTMASTKKASDKQNGQDAIALLTEDHKKVKKLFRDFEKLKEDGESGAKAGLVRQACLELTIHTQIEEEIFYPAAAGALDEQDMLNEAEVEHASAKELIAQLQDMQPSDELFDAKFIVLGEYVKHHIKEEEGEMFPQLEKSELDLEELGTQLEQRKQELMEEMQPADAGDEELDEEEEAELAMAEGDEEEERGGSTKKRKSSGRKKS